MPTETTVPLIGLVRVASFSDCSALVRSASAVSMSAWSDGDLLGRVGVGSGPTRCRPSRCPDAGAALPVVPEPLPVAPCSASPQPCRLVAADGVAARVAAGAGAAAGRRSSERAAARGLGAEGLAERRLVLRHGRLVLGDLLLVRRDRLEGGLARGLAGRWCSVLALVQSLWAWARSAASLLLVGRQRRLVLGQRASGPAVTVAFWPPVAPAWASSWWWSSSCVEVGVLDGVDDAEDDARLALLVLDQLGLVGGQGGLGRRDGLAQRGRVERAQRLPGRDLLARRHRHGGHLARRPGTRPRRR